MYRNIIILGLAIVLTLGTTGCLDEGGGGGGGGGGKEVAGNFTVQGSVDALAQSSSVSASADEDISLGQGDIIEISFDISVEDGDADTDSDQVTEITISEMKEGSSYNMTSKGGSTPYKGNLTIKWDEDTKMSGEWKVSITVECNPGPDQWPGPLIWSGVPDRGFSYTIDVTYKYTE
jgi:hypothetical protein